MDDVQDKRKPRKLLKVNETEGLSEYVRDNRRYWKEVLNQLDSRHKTALDESKVLAEVLPDSIYHRVCATLDMPIVTIEKKTEEHISANLPRCQVKEPQFSHRKCLHIIRELDSDTDVECCSSDEKDKPNIHQELLSKPVREQITWETRYLQPEKEDEKSLVKKADDLTHKIATEFCDYMKQLGGDQQSQLFTPKAIKELFQIEFDTHVARGLKVVPKELPCVVDRVARVTEHFEASRQEALDREIHRDMIAEQRPDRTAAFGQRLPKYQQYHAPRNHTKEMWRSSRHVPRDLVTLKTVWEGITNLRSVKEYCRWMMEHPELRRAPYLSSLGFFDSVVLDARLTFEAENQPPVPITASHYNNTIDPVDHIHKKLSTIADS